MKEVTPKIGSLFLDSGAHSFYKRHVPKSNLSQIEQARNPELYKAYGHFKNGQFVMSELFKDFVDDYAKFVIKHAKHIDHYATMDAIYNPEISWAVYEYLRNEFDLQPVPVIHVGTEFQWIDKYLKLGCDYIGLGGLGQQSTKNNYFEWADSVFSKLCPKSNNFYPIVKTHGFAMTSYDLLTQYPWYSVDSTSWVKTAAYGSVLVPLYENDMPNKKGMAPVRTKAGSFEWDYSRPPLTVRISGKIGSRVLKREQHTNLQSSNVDRKVVGYYWGIDEDKINTMERVQKWLDYCNIPLGSVNANGEAIIQGAINDDDYRKGANLIYYENLGKWIGPYPRQYVPRRAGFDKGLGIV